MIYCALDDTLVGTKGARSTALTSPQHETDDQAAIKRGKLLQYMGGNTCPAGG
jgi:hypothetical protein